MAPDQPTTLAFLLIVFLGGLNGVAVRFSNQELPPFEIRIAFEARIVRWTSFDPELVARMGNGPTLARIGPLALRHFPGLPRERIGRWSATTSP